MLLALAFTGALAEDSAVNAGGLRGFSSTGNVVEPYNFSEVPDMSGLPDHAGPYEEEPSDADANEPKPAMENWTAMVRNASSGSLGSLLPLRTWQESEFCNVHHTGFWCNGFTRVRCCKMQDGYAKCGSVANSSSCGWQSSDDSSPSLLGALWYNGWGRGGWGGWHIHAGWHYSSFCTSHHVGTFCSSHHRIHCCNDYGHYVECNSQYHDSYWC